MPINVTWTLGAPTRGRVAVQRSALAALDVADETQKRIDQRLKELGQRSARALANVAHMEYPSLQSVSPYSRFTSRALFAGITIGDRSFFYREWDTEPHWPPFGKHSELRAWVNAHGMPPEAAFFIARRMAPVGATNAVMGPYKVLSIKGKEYERTHTMTVSGEGGSESKMRPPRMVATSGRYALTDALAEEAEYMADQAVRIVADELAFIIPENG